jgi:hypothetical protein
MFYHPATTIALKYNLRCTTGDCLNSHVVTNRMLKVFIFETGSHYVVRLALYLQSSCLSLLNVGIITMLYCTEQK